MGFAIVIGPCFGCGRVFPFNPLHVPSIPADLSPTGEREPICPDCMEEANAQRIAEGKPPHPIHPEAYEGCPESELP